MSASRPLFPSLVAVAVLAALLSPACKREPKAPEEIPEVPISLNLRGQLASTVIQIVTGAAGYKVRWTSEALQKAERKAVTSTVQQADWREILDTVSEEAGVKWDWRRDNGEWLVWVHMPGEKWVPESES
jgi:hypothetical protein